MLPIERSALRLVGVLAHNFPEGATSDELRGQFKGEDNSFPPATFHAALRYAKERHWVVFRLTGDRLVYWADLQATSPQESPDEVEVLPDLGSGSDADGGANVALSSLVRIVGDSAASLRQRLRAAAAVLAYKVQDAAVIEFVRRFLESLCADADTAIDHRIAAGELLRKHEAPRVMSEIVRPAYRENEGTEAARREAWRNYAIRERELKIILETKDTPLPGWDDDLISDDYVPPPEGWPGPAPEIPLKDLVVARTARQDRLEREAIERLRHVQSERPQLLVPLASQRRNGSDGAE